MRQERYICLTEKAVFHILTIICVVQGVMSQKTAPVLQSSLIAKGPVYQWQQFVMALNNVHWMKQSVVSDHEVDVLLHMLHHQ